MRALIIYSIAAWAMLLGPPALAAGAQPPAAGEPQQHTPEQGPAEQRQQTGSGGAQEDKISPEQRMRRRFPQPIRVGDLVGLPILDDDDSTIGRIKHVVRTNEGKILLIVPYGGLFGLGRRLVPVPIEAVAILGRQVAALDMPIEEFEKAPTWYGANSRPLGNDEIIRIAITRR